LPGRSSPLPTGTGPASSWQAGIVSLDAGFVLAVFAPDGAYLRSEVFPGGEPVNIPFQEALYELAGETPCIAVTNGGWTDVSPVLDTGSWIATLPAIGSVTLDTAIASSSGHARLRARNSLEMGRPARRSTNRPPPRRWCW
jgi:hypothetical protein